MHEIAEFLHRHQPFDAFDEEALDEIARRTEAEFFPAHTIIFEQGTSPPEYVRIVRRGMVELLDHEQVLDGLGEGELFGHPSMLTGLPTEFAARAAEDTLCYRIAADDITPLLARPAGMRYLAREMRHREALRSRTSASVAARVATLTAASLIRRRCMVCSADTSIGDTARQMAEDDVSCAVVRLHEGLGIVTDHDLRVRVIAAGLSYDTPVRAVMTAPAIVTDPERPAADVGLMMIERGVRHIPVVQRNGTVLGVLRDVDLLALDARNPFSLRREIATASTPAQVREISSRLPAVLIQLHRAGTAASQISEVHAAMADAIITRLLEIIPADHGRSDLKPLWIALGSHGRRELSPGSDLDSAVTWPSQTTAQDEVLLRQIARATVESTGDTAGVSPDPHGAIASSQIFARSLESWRQAVRRWAGDPSVETVPVILSALLDGRAVGAGPAWTDTVMAEMTSPAARRELERWLLRLALGHRLPTGFLRSRVLGPGGARQEFDLKRDGLKPIVDMARYAGFVAGSGALSTPGRLRAGAQSGVLRGADAQMLIEAHELFTDLRVTHHVELLSEAKPVSDALDPGQLNSLSRNYIKDAFRLMAGTQRHMDEQLRSS